MVGIECDGEEVIPTIKQIVGDAEPEIGWQGKLYGF